MLGGDPGTAVPDAEPHLVAGDLGAHIDGRAGRRELGGVVEQVVEGLDELRPVAGHGQGNGYIGVHGPVDAQPGHALLDQLSEVELRRLHGHRPSLDVAQLAQVVDDLAQEVSLLDQPFGKPVPVLGRRVAQQALGGEAQRGDRRLQLVDQVRDELLPHRGQAPELGHVCEEHQGLPRPKAGLQPDHDRAPVVDEVRLGLVFGAAEDVEQAGLESHLHEARGQSVQLDLEQLARGPVGGHDATFFIEQQGHDRRVFEKRGERVALRDAPFRLLIVAAPIPDHGRSI